MKKIVTIGGGSGQSAILQHLKSFPLDITAIVSMVDDGGSTGKLREAYNVMPPGDVRRCIAALAENESFGEILEYRFADGMLAGHPVGNIMLSSFEQGVHSITEAVQLLSNIAQCKGTVLPVTTTPSTLYAELTDGTIVTGETHIDVPASDRAPIKRVYLEPGVATHEAVVTAISEADYIVLTIGDVFTSVIPNLLVEGVAEAIVKSKAKLVYTANRSTKAGETDNYSVLDCIQQLEQYLVGRKIDMVIADPTPVTESGLFTYSKSELEAHGTTCVEASVLDTTNPRMVSGERVAQVIFNLE